MSILLTPDCRALWLMMARQGGWWTVEALRLYWLPTFNEFELRSLLQGLLQGRHVIARKAASGDVLTYSVTSECTPLPGVHGTLVERSDGTSEFREDGEAHTPTALAYTATRFQGATP
jgi:hypothetical protein